MPVTLRTKYANYIARRLTLPNQVVHISGVGVPTNGGAGTGAGFAGPGSLYSDATTTTAKLYINTNTAASPTWVSVGTQT
jgi:hypothetical protein